MRRISFVAAAAVLSALALTTAAQAAPRQGPAGLAFYIPPRALPGHVHGGLIWERPLTDSAALPHARNTLLLYRSIGIAGHAVAVSGALSVPTGRPPRGGWPVIAYDHGTTGIADVCAPSRDTPSNPAHAYDDYIYPLLERWLRAGYAVVRTDYEGLGTPGVHPYLIGSSAARSTLDIVRAARALDPALSANVVIAGHSQGGQAALFAAALAPTWTPELHIRGTVAFAPASHLAEQSPLTLKIATLEPGISSLVALIVRGLDTADPSADESAMFTPAAAALYPETLTECDGQLSAPNSFGGLAPAAIFNPGADLTVNVPVIDRLDDPENLTISQPVLIEQGLGDTTVFPQYTSQLAAQLAAKGAAVTYHTYTGVTHQGVVTAAATDATAWLTARFGSHG